MRRESAELRRQPACRAPVVPSKAPNMGDRNTAETHWWQTRWFVVGMALASIIPLLWPTIPPLVDLPGHMGRYRVQLDIARRSVVYAMV